MMVLEWPCVPSRVLGGTLDRRDRQDQPPNRPAECETGPGKSVPQKSNASTLSRIVIAPAEGCLEVGHPVRGYGTDLRQGCYQGKVRLQRLTVESWGATAHGGGLEHLDPAA